LDDMSNGNCVGLLEMMAVYDPVLRSHLDALREAQGASRKLAVSSLSPKIQNEFIHVLASCLIEKIKAERASAEFFRIMCDSTPDMARLERHKSFI
ncbi:hypothetical protein Pmar_PMAR026880, partial [Perkinsus marinus ATCC 50983]